MQKFNKYENAEINLAKETIDNLTPFSFEAALARGIIVELSDWAPPEIGFGRGYFRTRVALTSRFWDTLLQAYVRRENDSLDGAFRRQQNDVLWLAAQALDRAAGCDAATFKMYFSVGGRVEDGKTLRVECRDREDRGYSQVLIGYPEDLVRL